MSEQDALATAVQGLAWELARNRPAGDRRMDVASPWEPGLTSEQRRHAWLATLSALDSIQAEAARLTETAASRAVEYGADCPDLAQATGATPRGARRRWRHLFARFGAGKVRADAGLGTLSAHGRAAGLRHDNPSGV